MLVVRHHASGWVREIARKDDDNDNAVYVWAAQQILARRIAEERPSDPIEYAASVHSETQALRYRAHDKLMRAFLDDDVFDGCVRVSAPTRHHQQASLLGDT